MEVKAGEVVRVRWGRLGAGGTYAPALVLSVSEAGTILLSPRGKVFRLAQRSRAIVERLGQVMA